MTLSIRVQERFSRFSLDVALSLSSSAFTAIVGPSGSGKTTLLRCIAGLHRPRHGDIRCGGQVWQDAKIFVPTHQRAVGYVFQEASLFPHLSVRGNMEFGYRPTKHASAVSLFDEVIELLGVEALLSRSPENLSGGERQRVAMARALLSQPKLLLLDEPLASLDPDSRAQIAAHLATVHQRLKIPVLYVTHAPAEVVRLANDIAYVAQGRLLAHGPINDVLTRAELPLSRLEDAGAALDLPVVNMDVGHHLMQVALGDARFSVAKRPLAVGTPVRVYIRARDVAIARRQPEVSSIQNLIAARVIDIHEEAEPAHRLLRLAVSGSTLLARVTTKTVVELQLRPNDDVFAQVKSVALAT